MDNDALTEYQLITLTAPTMKYKTLTALLWISLWYT